MVGSLASGEENTYAKAAKFILTVVQNNQVMFKNVCDGEYMTINKYINKIFTSTRAENGNDVDRKRATFTIEDWSEKEATVQCKDIEKRVQEEIKREAENNDFTHYGKGIGK